MPSPSTPFTLYSQDTMRLTALSICGTLLTLSSLSWTATESGEGDLLGDKGFGACVATLQLEEPCRQGQDDNACPYLFSLPPLTVHLPKQLRELDKIVKDLQMLKDNVDQLRKMCADCTVSQTERECEKQRESEHVEQNEGRDRHGNERSRVNERNPERPKDFRPEYETDRARAEKTMEGDGDADLEKRTTLEERGITKWEADRESDKGVVKENEKAALKEGDDGKTWTEGAKGNDKVGQAKVPAADGNERIVEMARDKFVEKNNRGTDAERNKEKDRKGVSKGNRENNLEGGKERKMTTNIKKKEKTEESDQHVRRDKTKETDRNTQTEEDMGSDRIKMSGEHDEHTNEERAQQREERKKKIEKGIKVERNNGKPKQTESIGHAEKEKAIKEGEGEEDREMGKDIKTEGEQMVQSVQRDSDGELASNKANERTDSVSISPTPQSTISLAPRRGSMDSNKASTFTSSFPPRPLSHLIPDVNQGMEMAAYGQPTQGTDTEVAGISGNPRPNAEASFWTSSRPTTTATISTLGGLGHQVTRATSRFISTTSPKPGAGFQGEVGSTRATATTTAPSEKLYTSMFPGVADRSDITTKKNISSDTKAGVRPRPGQGELTSEKHIPGTKPEADQKLKNPKNDRKSDRAPPLDKKTKQDQNFRPTQQKPTADQKSKPGKDRQQGQIPKPDRRAPHDDLTNDENLKNDPIPPHDQDHSTDQNKFSVQKTVPPLKRPVSHQRPVTVNATRSDKDPDREPESVEITIINQKSKPGKKTHHHLDPTDQPGQNQKPEKMLKNEEKNKSDQTPEPNQRTTPAEEPETGEVIIPSRKPNQESGIEFMRNSDENPLPEPTSTQDSTSGQKPIPDHINIPPDQRLKPNQKFPRVNQNLRPGHIPKLNQKYPEPKPNVKPKPGQAPWINQGLKTPGPDQMHNLNPKSLPDEIPVAESNKTSKLMPPPNHTPPTGPTLKPGATSVRRPKPAVQLRPSPKTKAALDPPRISGATSDGIQNSQTDMPPTSGPVKERPAEETHSPGDTEFSPSTKKTITLGPKTSKSPLLHALPEGFKMSPNSRITSDLRPQTAGQPPSIPMTTRPNKISRGILPSVIPSTSPGSTKLHLAATTESSLQDETIHNVEETAPRQTSDPDKMMVLFPSPSAQTTSTLSPNVRSTTPGTFGLEAAESSTPSARELRVKINQVAAFFNKSLNPNGRSPDRHPNEQPEGDQGGSRPDHKPPTRIPSKVTMARRDCSDILLRGERTSGVYLVTPDLRSKSFPVLCDMELGGGGWTVLQSRQDGSVSFNRTWDEYRSGFGELGSGEFWLGNNMIHLLTRNMDVVLRVELEDFDGAMGYAEYEHFKVASERLRYKLTVGGYSGTAGDALRFSKRYDHNNRLFTTPDRDNDRYPSGNCGAYYSSGWWFDACMAANLNGRYYVGKYTGVRDGIFWGTWHNISTEYYPTNDRRSFKRVRMMIRPKGFAP